MLRIFSYIYSFACILTIGCTQGLADHKMFTGNDKDEDGCTEIYRACCNKDKATLIKCLDNKYISSNIPYREFTPLLYCIHQGNIEFVSLLLSYSKTDPNIPIETGKVHPLYLAIERGVWGAVVSLLNNPRTDVNVRSKGMTSLYFAAISDQHAVFEQLICHKDLDVNLANEDGWTTLAMACFDDKDWVVEKLTKHSFSPPLDLNAYNPEGWPPLFTAAFKGNIICASHLLASNGIDIDKGPSDDRSNSPLAVAIEKDHHKVAQLLIEKGGASIAKAAKRRRLTPFEVCLASAIMPRYVSNKKAFSDCDYGDLCKQWDYFNNELVAKQFRAALNNSSINILEEKDDVEAAAFNELLLKIIGEVVFWYLLPEANLPKLARTGLEYVRLWKLGQRALVHLSGNKDVDPKILNALEVQPVVSTVGKGLVRIAKSSFEFYRSESLSGASKFKVNEFINIFEKQKGWGNVDPIKVFEFRNGNKYILDGHHRFAAAKKANIPIKYEAIPENQLGSYNYKSVHELISAATEVKPDKIG